MGDEKVDEKRDEETPDGDEQTSEDSTPEVSDGERAEIDEERQRRLDPDNRPDNVEIDNSDATLPAVEEFNEANADEATEASVGTSDPSETFRENPPSEEEVKEIEEERERRLDPDNRPDNVEVVRDRVADSDDGVRRQAVRALDAMAIRLDLVP